MTSISSLPLVYDNPEITKFLQDSPRPNGKKLKTLFGSQIERLNAKDLFSLNLEANPIQFPYKQNDGGCIPFSCLFDNEELDEGKILSTFQSVASTVYRKVSSVPYTRSVSERLNEEPAIRIIGATGYRFSSKTIPQSAAQLESNHLKLCLAAVYESIRSKVLGPILMEKTTYLTTIRTNMVAILSKYTTSGSYEFAENSDGDNGDEEATFVNQLEDPQEVEAIKTVASKRRKREQFYEALEPLVKFVMGYEGFFYRSEEDDKKYWDPDCRSAVEVLIEVSFSFVLSDFF